MIDRSGLETLASGKIASILGPLFEQQDCFVKQVRLPEPPLLLVDRVLRIEAIPGLLGSGQIWTETDIIKSSWYLHRERMPMGIMIEAGQADLLLISYMGIDFENKGNKVYRLLGCTLTFHKKELPKMGETIQYEISITNHAKYGNTRLFFFEFEGTISGRKSITVRDAQAGFFTEKELANSEGIRWEPSEFQCIKSGSSQQIYPSDSIANNYKKTFGKIDVQAFSRGNLTECFGSAYFPTLTQANTPTIPSGQMLLIDEVLEFNPNGGPCGRGYLKARHIIDSTNWYFKGHFKNDPCMPGSLMIEGCTQAMSFYLAALGMTIERPGHYFVPVPNFDYKISCRGQVSTESKELIYEIFVHETFDYEEPTIFADLLCTVDGRKAFKADYFGLKLVP